jgi:hypothetical protein
MRKKIINRSPKEPTSNGHAWLDLERLAQVEITSEETGHPVESALATGVGPGWLAGEAGEQRIRLLFDEPQALSGGVLCLTIPFSHFFEPFLIGDLR